MDTVLLNKVAIIERCLARIQEEYIGHEEELEGNYTKQDSLVFNLQRVCEAAIDMALRVIRIHKLGLPQESRDAFQMLEDHNLLSSKLSKNLKAMVGFRNIAVHDYQKINLDVVRGIIENHLADFEQYIDEIRKLV